MLIQQGSKVVNWSRRSTGVFESEMAGSLYVIRSAEMDSHGGRKRKVWWLYQNDVLVKSCSFKHTAQAAKDWLSRELAKANAV